MSSNKCPFQNKKKKLLNVNIFKIILITYILQEPTNLGTRVI